MTFARVGGGEENAWLTTALKTRPKVGETLGIPESISECIHYTDYPLLGYSYLNSSTLHFANLAKNCVQSRIDISPFRFKRFVQAGIQKNGLSDDQNGMSTLIYFLAERISASGSNSDGPIQSNLSLLRF